MALEIAPHIAVDPDIRFGKPIIKGTRITVELVLARLAAGMTAEDIVQEYEITMEDIQAVLAYAAQVIAGEEIRLVA